MFRPRRVLGIFASVLVFLCCVVFVLSTIDHADTRRHLQDVLGSVDAADGIDEDEAHGIAWAYFLGYVSACGGPDKGTLVDGQWVIPASSGMGGKRMDAPIRIDARTGAVSQAGGPSFPGYRSFRLILLWGIPLDRLKDSIENYYFDNWT